MASSDDVDSGRDSPWMEEDGFEVVHDAATMSEIKEADIIRRSLQERYEPQKLKNLMIRLQTLFKNAEVKKYLEDNMVHTDVLAVMKHFVSFSEIQQIGLELLCQFLDESLAIEMSLQTGNIHKHVLSILTENISDVPIHQSGTRLLSSLFESRYTSVSLTNNLMTDLIDYLFHALKHFQNEKEIQLNTLRCLHHILQKDDNSAEIFVRKYLPVVLDTITLLQDVSEVVCSVFRILFVVAHTKELRQILVEDRTHEKIIPYIQIEAGIHDEEVMDVSLQLLCLLFEDEAAVKYAVQSGFIMDSLVPVMIGNPLNDVIQVSGLQMFRIAAKYLLQMRNQIETASQWLKVIYFAMSKLMDSADVQEAGCLALCELLIWKSEAYMWIGESSELRQDPLHTVCLGAMMMGRQYLNVFKAACQSFYHLTADNDGLCKCLMEKNAHLAVLEGLESHLHDPGAAASACRALRGLAIFHDEHKQAISVQEPTLMLMNEIIRKFPDNVDVQCEVISTIACLADIDVFRHLCVIKKLQVKILVAMDIFSSNEIIQEAGIEALAVLGGSASGAEILNTLRVVNKIIRCLRSFPKNKNIQKKGLILIQILADQDLVSSSAMCQLLADIIREVMTANLDNISILRESVVAMQILSEKSQDMGETFIAVGLHEVLFQLLDQLSSDQALHDLASECLYVIGCVQNLKSGMLLSACKNGFLAGVECLVEIGADVNIGEGADTPLYYAVQNNFEAIVQYLLQQSIRDVQTSLQLSVREKKHIITGMLLSHTRQHNDGGTVLWSNFGLGDLRPEWFAVSVSTRKAVSPRSSGSGKRFVEKMKRSEQKRMRRLRHSPSDSRLEIYRHRCFRYRRPSDSDNKITPKDVQEYENKDPTPKSKRPQSLPKSLFRNGKREALAKVLQNSSSQTDKPSPTKQSPTKSFPALELFPATSTVPEDLVDLPVFEHSAEERQEWEQTTLTGANIPFSPSDPRRNNFDKGGNHNLDTPRCRWLRKYSLLKLDKAENMVSDSTDVPDALSSSESEQFRSVPIYRTFSTDLESEMETSTEGSRFLEQTNQTTHYNAGLHMTTLDVSQNNITSLSLLLSADSTLQECFSRLEKLDVSCNQLTDVPGKLLTYFTRLQFLDLKNNKLEHFPREVQECTSLIGLDLSHNMISGITKEDLKGIYSIRNLNLSSNKISTFPENLDKAMPSLEKLTLYKNKIVRLPSTVMKLPDLRRLNLSQNNVTAIPDEFLSACHKLESLELVDNGLKFLPSEDIAKHLPRLNTLRLRGNHLTEKEPFFIPKFILELQNLRIVDLKRNHLSGFPPPMLWKSQILKEILVSDNNITKLNLEGAKAWSKLEKLHISSNSLAELPKEIGQLVSLQSLDIGNNKAITTLPDELGRCSRMWELTLTNVSLDLSDSLVKGRVKDLITYLHNKLKKAQRYFRMKLMVVGYGNRGKTSLLNTLKKKTKHRIETSPTVGVVVDDWRYERQNYLRTVKYTLSTWDFAGQEEFYSTHQCFLSNRALYLVVYDVQRGPEEIDRLKPWLSNIHFRAPGCPVVVVGTHYDKLKDADEIVQSLEDKLFDLVKKPGFPEIWWSSFVDATKENQGIQQLRHKIKDVIDRYKIKGQAVMGQKVPASYVRLAELLSEECRTLEEVRYPVIRHGRLVQMVKNEELDLDVEEELELAVRFLHEGGVLLHYNETALQLRDFYFINPGWLCRMMAQVVTVKMINPFIDTSGIMKKSDVNLLFRGENFPPSLIPQYLRLLEKFEIALPQNEENLLVPCRLPEQKPVLKIPSLAKHEMISRIYSMPYMPLGFWSRLITRLIVFSNSSTTETMLQLPAQPNMQYWRQGIFVKWAKSAFFLVDSATQETAEELHITVPASLHGYRLLGFLVDHIDALIDEWYPGLTSVDPLLGRELLEKVVPCVQCTGPEPHKFMFEDLLRQSEQSNFIKCPVHDGDVQLAYLAPDVMLQDLEETFHMNIDELELKESSEYLLGDGGFGSVYRAMYKNQVVAAKVFSAIGDVHPHKMLRQEATILRRLKHPCVVSLIAAGVRPNRVVLLELAPLGSLGSILKNAKPLSRNLQQRIAVQVAEGLNYLHRLMIVYRDLKPENVLVFSLSPTCLINAKISDYGISQFTTLYGLTAQEGTPAFRAPEVVRREIYSFQADIYSFGIMLYSLLTGGCHPYDELEFKSEMDKAVADNRPIPPITQRGQAPWPDMQDVISQCLQQIPDHRPRAYELCSRLSSAELFCLKDEILISVGTTVECMAHQVIDKDNIRLWIASGDSEYMELSWLNLMDYQDDNRVDPRRNSVDYSGRILREGRILCMLPIDADHVLLGTQTGKIWVFNAKHSELVHCTRQLPDSVLCLHLMHGAEDDLVLAGLANGGIKFCPVSEILQEPDTTLLGMNLGKDNEPVRCIIQTDKKIIASCGTKIMTFRISRNGLGIETEFSTSTNSSKTMSPINAMAVGRYVFLSRRRSSVLEVWDLNKERQRERCDIGEMFNLSKEESRITSLLLQERRALWVGTGGGHVAVVDATLLTPIVLTWRHTASVRCLMPIKTSGFPVFSVVLSGGLGFRHRPGEEVKKETKIGCIAVWDSQLPRCVQDFNDEKKQRQELEAKIKVNRKRSAYEYPPIYQLK